MWAKMGINLGAVHNPKDLNILKTKKNITFINP